MDLHKKTEEYINSTVDDYLSENGQFFTSPELTQILTDRIPIKDDDRVLDPACGTGEILRFVENNYDVKTEGWEKDPELVDIANKITNSDIINTNSLFYEPDKKYDVIIGNPPYFEIKQTDKIKKHYKEVLYGRTNIYTLFIYKSLQVLKQNGHLGFIVPTSMNNGRYFKELRRYIVDNCSIEYMEVDSNKQLFEGATQSIMYLVLKKESDNHDDYVFRRGDHILFTENATELRESFNGCKTIEELGFDVVTGDLMWNYNKDKLSDTNTDDTVPFIWSKNITDGSIKLNNHDKQQYIKYEDTHTGPAIVVNRVTGGNKYGYINAGYIPKNVEFVAENHVNIIKPTDKAEITTRELCDKLNSERVNNAIRHITGNNHLSKTELKELVPIKH